MYKHKRNSSIFQSLADRVASLGTSDDNTPLPVIVHDPENNTQSIDPIVDIPLLSVDEFSFNSILNSVSPEVEAFMEAYVAAMSLYRNNVSEEINSAALMEAQLTDQMARIDKLAVKTLRNCQARIAKAQTAYRDLQGVEDLAKRAETVYESVSNIVSMLHDVEQVLPASDRLTVHNSLHMTHYPNLYKLLHNSRTVHVKRVPRKSASMSALSLQNQSPMSSGPKRHRRETSVVVGSGLEEFVVSRTRTSEDFENHEQRILLCSRVPDGYPRALLSYRTLSPRPQSPKGLSHDSLPMAEAESASTITSVSRSFSLQNIVNVWSSRPLSAESAQERLQRIMGEGGSER